MNIQIGQGVVQGANCDGEASLELETKVGGWMGRLQQAPAAPAAGGSRCRCRTTAPDSPHPAPALQIDEGSCLVPDDSSGRVFKFWVLDNRGCKLDYAGMSSLVYTLSSVLGYRSHPTVPPDQELLLSGKAGLQ